MNFTNLKRKLDIKNKQISNLSKREELKQKIVKLGDLKRTNDIKEKTIELKQKIHDRELFKLISDHNTELEKLKVENNENFHTVGRDIDLLKTNIKTLKKEIEYIEKMTKLGFKNAELSILNLNFYTYLYDEEILEKSHELFDIIWKDKMKSLYS